MGKCKRLGDSKHVKTLLTHCFPTEQRPLGRHRIHIPQARLWLRLFIFQHRLFHQDYFRFFFLQQVLLHEPVCHYYQVELDHHQDYHQATTNHNQHQAC